ncbi:DoxX family membrane protein [Tsukamurella sp. 8F]|uniref:DoxX family membrane protein n=1 Tax=unclassified Tsukamurella TaxID=2633480 RepID=UPI0023B8E608|nr:MULTISPECIES: DoxX family membrane protein [unclassified Tsukamurella]MDF0530597.1 DoxX family membrane protein [Tsukamurella sp. 8J]MDF0587798.1 DoxX family membrane protein [Tsukamurella sp. 8F]
MIRRIARPLLGSYFVYNGVTGLTRGPERAAEAARPLVEKATASLPDSELVPEDPRVWVRVNSGVQLGGGLLLATGRFPRVASLALAASLVPTTAVENQFWNEDDPTAAREQQVRLLKDLSLLGGLLIAGFDTEGRPGVAWRTRRAADRARSRVAGAVESVKGGSDDQPGWAERAGARLSEVAEQTAPVVSDAAAAGAERISELTSAGAETARRQAPVVAERARRLRDSAERVGRDVAAQASDVAAQASERARAAAADR